MEPNKSKMDHMLFFNMIASYSEKNPSKVTSSYYDEINPEISHITFREDNLFKFIEEYLERLNKVIK